MSVEKAAFVIDRQYKKINYTEATFRLLQTKEIRRLAHISLSTTPPSMVRGGNCATRFEHSLGVQYLTGVACDNPDFKDVAYDLSFAALAHDIGSPPFSHLSEGFMEKHIGITHEENACRILQGSSFAKEVKSQGGSLKNIEKLILGEDKPFSDVLNGSVDTDNLDNVLRYGMSIGLLDRNAYSPENIASAYDLEDNQVVLKSECVPDLEKWIMCRKLVYDYVYSTHNGSPGSMIHRALDLASKADQLNPDFFEKTDDEALDYLKNHSNSGSAALVQRAETWNFYTPIVDYQTTEPSSRLEEMATDENFRGMIADDLARQHKIPQENVCVYLRRGRGFRKIHLPIIDADGFQTNHEQSGSPTWIAQVYINPEDLSKANGIKEMACSVLGI